jgi:NhaP-type Na+/H+ or K+/H+ antiporter
MAMMILLILPIVRAVMVYFLPGIYYLLKKTFPLNPKELKICWYSGIVRGVIAFALCLQITGANVDFVRTIGLIIVMMTTIVGSSLLKPFVKWIGMD